MRKFFEKSIEGGLLISGSISSFAILLIVFFLFKEAGGLFNAPATEEGYVLAVNKNNDVGKLSPEKITWGEFFGGTKWYPTSTPAPIFGLIPLLLGTLLVSIGAIVLSLPFGIAVAIYMAE